jgi:hypothetical protein
MTKTILSSQLYITEASESKAQTEKELSIPDPQSDQDFEEIIANNASTTEHDRK